MEDRRVVITGLGTINPVGATVDATWKNLLSGTSGIGRVQRVDVSDLPSKIAGEVSDFEVTDYIPKRLARRGADSRPSRSKNSPSGQPLRKRSTS